MDTIKRLLVGLDLTPMDDSEIAYAAFLCAQSAIEKVYFVHAERSFELPPELMDGTITKDASVQEQIREALTAKVKTAFQDLPHIQTEILVLEGNQMKALLKVAREVDADVLLAGRKRHLTGSGVLPRKLLRASRMSVMFIPEDTVPALRKIVVSLDFNEYSMMALDQILHSALTRPEVLIECLHIYQVPPGYITLGQSYEEFDLRMQANAEAKFREVLKRFPELEGRTSLKLVKQHHDEDIGEVVVREAKQAGADLLVMGAAGKSGAALFMLGSTTEKILHKDHDIPLLIFKRKDEEIGFLDALLRDE